MPVGVPVRVWWGGGGGGAGPALQPGKLRGLSDVQKSEVSEEKNKMRASETMVKKELFSKASRGSLQPDSRHLTLRSKISKSTLPEMLSFFLFNEIYFEYTCI